MGKIFPGFAIAALIFCVLAGCNQIKPVKVTTVPKKKVSTESPQTIMLRVARQVQTCWFKTKDPALRPYKMASELDSYSGRPRILIVPKNKPGGLPKLVAEAEKIGGKARFSAYGPLLNSKHGTRLNASLNAWSRGRKTC